MAKEELQSFIKHSLTSSQAAGNKKHEVLRFGNEEHNQTTSEIEAEELFLNSEWSIYPPIKNKEQINGARRQSKGFNT